MQNKKGNLSVVVSFIIVACVIGLGIYFMSHKPKSTADIDLAQNNSYQSDDSNTTDDSTINNKPTDVSSDSTTKPMDSNKRLLSNFTPISKVTNLQKIDLVTGKGEAVKPGATVSVHYTGAVAATGEVFQSSKDFGTDPITFPLSGVIKGWTDGIPGMKIGGTRRLIIPADQAYGATPPQGSGIPANADLVFDVELIAVK